MADNDKMTGQAQNIWTRIRSFAIAVFAIILLAILAIIIFLDLPAGHRFIISQIEKVETEDGMRFRVGDIDGSIYSKATLNEVAILDPKGRFLTVKQTQLKWYPVSWIFGTLSIDQLILKQGELIREPELKQKKNDDGPTLPDFDIFIGDFQANNFIFGQEFGGSRQTANIRASGDMLSGRLRGQFNLSTQNKTDMADINIDISPDENKFKIAAKINAKDNGVIQKLAQINWANEIIINGQGDWDKWRGQFLASQNSRSVAKLELKAKDGLFSADGAVSAIILPHGIARQISSPTLNIDLSGRYKDRMARMSGILSSDAVNMDIDGGYDLSIGGVDSFKINANIIKPSTLTKDLVSKNMNVKALLNGRLSQLRGEYIVTANAIGTGNLALNNARLTGDIRRMNDQTYLPMKFTAISLNGLGDELGALLKNINASGNLVLRGNKLTGDGLSISTNRIKAMADFSMNTDNGQFNVPATLSLPKYEIDGLGSADVLASLTFAPARPKGVNITGKASAILTRLDNGFANELTGGSIKLFTGVGIGPDGILKLPNLKIASQKLSFAGNGSRGKDGLFSIKGMAQHAEYGAAKAEIFGNLARPKVALFLDKPFDPLGLNKVTLTLNPVERGFDFATNGGSTLGPFDGTGAILLPKGGDAIIEFDRLAVSSTILTGYLRPASGGLDGKFKFNEGGVIGQITLAPQNGGQGVSGNFDIKQAFFRGPKNIRIRTASGKFDALFIAGNSNINANIQAQGVSAGDLILGRLAGNVKMRNGRGKAVVSVAGTRGSNFTWQSQISISPDKYIVKGNGSFRRQPLRLARAALITSKDDIWKIHDADLIYGNGKLNISGQLGGGKSAIDMDMQNLSLSLADLADNNVGLSGIASGKLRFVNQSGTPTGSASLKIKGLSRSGLSFIQEPLDMDVNAQLTANQLALRGLVSQKSDVSGRVQGRIILSNGGALLDRIYAGDAKLEARFNGPIAALWRLTGIELFDLGGNVSLATNIGGTINNPSIKGVFSTSKAVLNSPATGLRLTNLGAQGRFDGARLLVRNISGTTANGGKISGLGSFSFGGRMGVQIAMDLQAENAILINRDDFGATVTGPIKIRSQGAGGIIAGRVTVVKSDFNLGKANASQILPQLNVREINGRNDLPLPPAAAAPWKLAIEANIPNRMAVRGLGLDSEWSAKLKIGGNVDAPTLLGRAEMIRGNYEFSGRRFRLTEGNIYFDRNDPPNPRLDIVAQADLSDVDASILVSGRSANPQIQFTSTPQLPEEELLSRLLFGSSVPELSATEALQLGVALSGLRDGGTGFDPINAIRQSVGLDRLRLVSADGTTRGTSVAAGKYLGRRTYVEIVSDGKGYTATQIEFRVTRWLSILSSISSIGRQSLNVRVKRDY
ncbi:hypothetical protein LPB140_05970 [Sphingorhabdus lutea]|uniref:Translocation and assembly module TamB C-terminal domain-containing protein n=1 Tax=Sphingorhabdus lutea TaxID=1913578 RepID=A0A1L3JB98_9SPHN|nr:translocation/assembly module TamB domain-containing protein [Sphingorhabdus lutea]APG62417.1 hypothetical protein LPB140_05970 [Sphingorhabdus lutea]